MTSDTRVVELRGGVSVAADALRLAFDLEDRGLTLSVERGRLVVRPRDALTPPDVVRVKQHVRDLMKIASYQPPEETS